MKLTWFILQIDTDGKVKSDRGAVVDSILVMVLPAENVT